MIPASSPGLNPKAVLDAAGLMALSVVKAITTLRLNPNRALFNRVGERMCDSSSASVCRRDWFPTFLMLYASGLAI